MERSLFDYAIVTQDEAISKRASSCYDALLH
jgi:hypothetical protein